MSFVESVSFTAAFILAASGVVVFLVGCLWTVLPVVAIWTNVFRDTDEDSPVANALGLTVFSVAAFSLATLSAYFALSPLKAVVNTIGGVM